MLQANISVGLAALCFLYIPTPKAMWTYSPLAVGLTSYGTYSPFLPYRADLSVGLAALIYLDVPPTKAFAVAGGYGEQGVACHGVMQ